MSIIIFLLVLGILIAVHEWGHFIAAKKQGIQVDEFAIGFGPKLFKKVWDGTEFSICAIPLGGYVKMAGDERDKCSGKEGEFYSKSVGQRAIVVLAGPVVNYILAFLCFSFVFMIGYVDIEKSAQNVQAIVGEVLTDSPAEKSGLLSEDIVVGIDGVEISNWSQMQDVISETTKDQLNLTVLRNDMKQDITVIPQVVEVKDIFGKKKNIRRIGIGAKQIDNFDDIVIERYGPVKAFQKGAQELWSVTSQTYVALYQIVTGARSAKEGMTGLIGIFFVIKYAASIGFSYLLHIVGVISASLAIFNLLPIIPLDGGHLFLYLIEKIRGKPLSAKVDEGIAKVGFSLIMALALYVFYVDFERIGLIDKIISLWGKLGL